METSGGSGGNRGTSSGTGRVPEEGRGQQRDRTPEEMNWVDRRQTYIPSGTNQFGLCLRPGMPPGSGGSYCSKKAVPVIPATPGADKGSGLTKGSVRGASVQSAELGAGVCLAKAEKSRLSYSLAALWGNTGGCGCGPFLQFANFLGINTPQWSISSCP